MTEREIKFRAWNKRKKCFETDMTLVMDLFFNAPIELEDIGLVLSQYTGLKDKKGKEIYEGDIVRIRFHHEAVEVDGEWIPALGRNLRDHVFEEIRALDYQYPMEIVPHTQAGLANRQTVEVIGNIYENPELVGK